MPTRTASYERAVDAQTLILGKFRTAIQSATQHVNASEKAKVKHVASLRSMANSDYEDAKKWFRKLAELDEAVHSHVIAGTISGDATYRYLVLDLNPDRTGGPMKQSELKNLSIKQLVEFYNANTDGTPVRTFATKHAGIRRCSGFAEPDSESTTEQSTDTVVEPEQGETEMASKKSASKKVAKKSATKKSVSKKSTTKVRKPRGESKFGKLRASFPRIGTKATRSELMKITGFDKSNLITALAILRNKKRTKDLIVVEFDRETETYKRTA